LPTEVTVVTRTHDAEELYRLFRSAMEPYVNAARGTPWNDERERAQFLTQLAPASVQLILLKNQVIGFIDFRAGENGCLLHTMVIAPEWQSNGIGSAVLRQLKAKSDQIALAVLKTNPRARHFYEQAGFRECGSTEHHCQMAWVSGVTMGTERNRQS
jgi:ribosomal protein S18 acetylase RimI-like enzyme